MTTTTKTTKTTSRIVSDVLLETILEKRSNKVAVYALDGRPYHVGRTGSHRPSDALAPFGAGTYPASTWLLEKNGLVDARRWYGSEDGAKSFANVERDALGACSFDAVADADDADDADDDSGFAFD